jgi:hypothetical protein
MMRGVNEISACGKMGETVAVYRSTDWATSRFMLVGQCGIW